MNWNDPVARLHLVEQVGHEEYNRRIEKWISDSVIEVVNGYRLRSIPTPYGGLIQVMNTRYAYKTIEMARDYANGLEPGPHV